MQSIERIYKNKLVMAGSKSNFSPTRNLNVTSNGRLTEDHGTFQNFSPGRTRDFRVQSGSSQRRAGSRVATPKSAAIRA
jgi:hypothetical protein